MQRMIISLPDPLKRFVDAQVVEGHYTSVSEYVQELIRADARRKNEDRLETLLLEGIDSEETELAQNDWNAIRKEARSHVTAKTDS